MCTCGINLLQTEESSLVCPSCGIERRVLAPCTYLNCGFQMRHSPFMSGYSRSKRFKQMVEMLLFPASSNADQKALRILFEQKSTIKCLGHIIHLLTTSKLQDKRFCSLHLFSKLFNPKYKPPPHKGDLFYILERMKFQFELIELRYKSLVRNKPFINYTFIIRFLLLNMKLFYYLKFVKKLKCPKRRQRYQTMLHSFGLDRQLCAVQIHS